MSVIEKLVFDGLLTKNPIVINNRLIAIPCARCVELYDRPGARVTSELQFPVDVVQARCTVALGKRVLVVLTSDYKLWTAEIMLDSVAFGEKREVTVELDGAYDFFVYHYFVFFYYSSGITTYSLETEKVVAQFCGLLPSSDDLTRNFEGCRCDEICAVCSELLSANSADSTRKISEMSLLCDNCKNRQVYDAKSNGLLGVCVKHSDFYGSQPFTSFAFMRAAWINSRCRNVHWHFQQICFASTPVCLAFFAFGNVPQIIYYRIPFSAILEAEREQRVLTVFPAHRIYGLMPLYPVQQNPFECTKLTTIKGDCEFFADDVQAMNCVSISDEDVVVIVMSAHFGLFYINFTPQPTKAGSAIERHAKQLAELTTTKIYDQWVNSPQFKAQFSTPLQFYCGNASETYEPKQILYHKFHIYIWQGQTLLDIDYDTYKVKSIIQCSNAVCGLAVSANHIVVIDKKEMTFFY